MAEYIYLPPRVELGGLKDCHVLNIIVYGKVKYTDFGAQRCQNTDYMKRVRKKIQKFCRKLKSQQLSFETFFLV